LGGKKGSYEQGSSRHQRAKQKQGLWRTSSHCSAASGAAVSWTILKPLARVPATLARPSIDPELMIQMLIVGYWYGLRLERKLAQEVELHLAYRWFCRLNLDNKVSHHSTFSENRPHRFRKSDVLRHMQRDTFGDKLWKGIFLKDWPNADT
jgi:Transposase domain (DUF772)